jgi:NADPH:quinone reductase-like Zn-dependent oxidoreductase
MPKIVRFHQVGGPEVLKLEELPAPQPQKDEVLIRVDAIGLNRAESMFRSGQYLYQPKFPAGLGYEASGTVKEVGPGVTGLKPGDRVSSVPSFSLLEYGTYGEVALLPARALARYPENLNPVEGASIWMQYLTAYGLIEIGKMEQGNHVLITAAASSVRTGRDPVGECGRRYSNCDYPEQSERSLVTGCRGQVRGQHEDGGLG